MKKKTIISLFATAVILLALVGCNKEEVVDEAQDQEILDETTFAETVFEQLASDVDEVTLFNDDLAARVAEDETDNRLRLRRFGYGDCVEITREKPDDAEFPVIITIDFGDGCTSWFYNVVKSGKVIITITGKLHEEGSQRIVTFDEFFVNDNQIEGIFTLTNLGNASYSWTLVDGKITTPEGNVITRNSERFRTRIEGGDTPERRDDVFEITGSAYGETLKGHTYTMNITTPLIRSLDCFWITSGTIEKVIDETMVIIIDFGDGECDNIATKKVGDEDPEEFEMNCRMKRWRWHKWFRRIF
jgi:hypothetical protein